MHRIAHKKEVHFALIVILFVLFFVIFWEMSPENPVTGVSGSYKAYHSQDNAETIFLVAGCGDRFCSNVELLEGYCEADCGASEILEDDKAARITDEKRCGDGFCSDEELLAGSCSEDCGSVEEIIEDADIRQDEQRCGDGFCSNEELLAGSCAEDCGMPETGMPA